MLQSAGPMIVHASGSHILRGFLKSPDLKIMGLRRDIVLAPPSEDEIKILGPQMPKEEGTVEIDSAQMAQIFATYKSVFGVNAAVVASKEGVEDTSRQGKEEQQESVKTMVCPTLHMYYLHHLYSLKYSQSPSRVKKPIKICQKLSLLCCRVKGPVIIHWVGITGLLLTSQCLGSMLLW